MHTLLQDLHYGARTLLKSRGFAVVAILTLAIGIGANTAMFSVINGVLLSPLPVPDPDRVALLYADTPQFGRGSISWLNFQDWRKRNRTFEDMAAARQDNYTLTGVGQARRLQAAMVSHSFFNVLRVKPLLGRTFEPEDDTAGRMPTVVLSESLWKEQFGGDPQVLGRAISLNGVPYTVIGVVGDTGVQRNPLYVPFGVFDKMFRDDRKVSAGTVAVGRLKPGVTLQQGQADLTSVANGLAQEYPEINRNQGIALVPLTEDVVGGVRKPLLVLLAAVGFVLLIACANVANLLLARASGRRREFAIRAALGAARIRVVRQLLTEGLLLGLLGAGAGLILAAWTLRPLIAAVPGSLPRASEIQIGGAVFGFALLMALIASVVFSLVPALESARSDINETLKEGGRGTTSGRHRAQRVFVVAELALALVLATGAGLLIRTLSRLWDVDPGFDPHNALTFSTSGTPSATETPAAVRTRYEQMLQRLRALPGVQGASLLWGSVPMIGDSEIPFWVQGRPKPTNQSEMDWALFYYVAPDYRDVMRIPLLRGRFVSDQDVETAQKTVVIDENLAKALFPGQDPIGQRLNCLLLGQVQVVGIVGHVKHWGLDADSTARVKYQVYMPYRQFPEEVTNVVAAQAAWVVRTQNDPTALADAVRKTVAESNPNVAVFGVQTMDEVISDTLAQRRFLRLLLVIFAGLALALASIGIYGVISYTVAQSTHEIGLRIALGAGASQVLSMVLRQALRLTAIGVVLGVVGGVAATRAMSGLLFGVGAADPLTFVAVACLLAAVALLASYIPARRATKIDPMVALRYE